MALIRGKTYIWRGDDCMHVWGEWDEMMPESIWATADNQVGRRLVGVKIPMEVWEKVEAEIIKRAKAKEEGK